MKNSVGRAGMMSLVIAASLMGLSEAAMAKGADPAATCNNPLLTYRQRYQCKEELENVQTKADQTKIVRKFTDLIRAAEKAKADK